MGSGGLGTLQSRTQGLVLIDGVHFSGDGFCPSSKGSVNQKTVMEDLSNLPSQLPLLGLADANKNIWLIKRMGRGRGRVKGLFPTM